MRPALALLLAPLLFAMNPPGAQAREYLFIPSIAGADSMPGYDGLIPLLTFSWFDHTLTFGKAVDGTSPGFFAAALAGTHFATADVLFYEGPGPTLDVTFQMTDVVVASDQEIGGDSPFERVELRFETGGYVVPSPPPVPVPEPSMSALTLAGLLAVAALALKRRWSAGAPNRYTVDGLHTSTHRSSEVRQWTSELRRC